MDERFSTGHDYPQSSRVPHSNGAFLATLGWGSYCPLPHALREAGRAQSRNLQFKEMRPPHPSRSSKGRNEPRRDGRPRLSSRAQPDRYTCHCGCPMFRRLCETWEHHGPPNCHPEAAESVAPRPTPNEVKALSGRLSPLPKSRAKSREPMKGTASAFPTVRIRSEQ